MKKILISATLAVGLACAVAAVGWNAEISLSVLVGGVIGLANLWLWQRVVAGIAVRSQGGQISGGALAVRMVVKLVPLVVLVAVVFRGSLPVVGVMTGFGSALFGLVWAGLMEKR